MSTQSDNSQKPDLDDNFQVASMHASVDRKAAASAREQQLRENGLEPISTWVFLVGTVVALIAGSVIFNSGELFNYDSFVKKGYIQKEEEGAGNLVPKGPASEVYLAVGGALYSSKCAACHQANGAGLPGAFPPLAKSEWVEESPFIPLLVAANGLNGPIEVAGQKYNSVMASQNVASDFNDFQLAALVYFLQNSWGNQVDKVYTPAQIAQFRKAHEEHGGGMFTAEALESFKGKSFEGEFYAPDQIINKKTGEPIE